MSVKLTPGIIAENLEILRTETRMLRVIVSGLLLDASPEAREHAIRLLKVAAEAEPRFVVDAEGAERTRQFVTELASSWIAEISAP